MYFSFRGTSGIDIDLRRVDIDQCPLQTGSTQLNIFAATDKCKKRTTDVCIIFFSLILNTIYVSFIVKQGFCKLLQQECVTDLGGK